MARQASKAAANEQLAKMMRVSKAFESFRPASEILTKVKAVQTRFCQVDHATRVEGWPIERFTLVHGPSNHGKTIFAAGIIDSFLTLGHLAFLIDAERTSPITWFDTLMGEERSRHPMFKAERPESYEAVIANVRNFLNILIKLKADGDLPPDTSAIIAVDSLRKLVPKDAMALILEANKLGEYDADGNEIKAGKDRSGQIQAKMNAAWMDEVVPMLERAGAGMLAIGREMQDPDASTWDKKVGNDYKIGGGGAIFYDSSLVVRIERESFIQHGDGKARKVYGERHRATIRKTKVAGKDDKVAVGHFHTSNGVLVREGFDRARDVLELAVRLDVVSLKGSSYSHDGDQIAAGQHQAVVELTDDPERCRRIEQECRATFRTKAPWVETEDAPAYNPKTGEIVE
jgi:hypothetical protein